VGEKGVKQQVVCFPFFIGEIFAVTELLRSWFPFILHRHFLDRLHGLMAVEVVKSAPVLINHRVNPVTAGKENPIGDGYHIKPGWKM
jgi:hypothetical protein